MIISTFAARFFGSQIQRIEDGFVSLGHFLSNAKSDIIYCNDATKYDEAINHKKTFKGTILILNALDIPHWIKNFDEWLKANKEKFKQADILTCISKTVQNDIKKYLDLDAAVIYNPIKNITALNIYRSIAFLSVGRMMDPGKRFSLVKETLNKIPGGQSNLLVVGSENPYYGRYEGIVDDYMLNELYNKSKYMIYSALRDGMGLPPIEMICSMGISVLCKDSPTSVEFFPEYLLCEPNSDSILEKLKEIEKDYSSYQKKIRSLADEYREKFSGKQIAKNILNLVK